MSNAHIFVFREPSGKKKSGKEMISVRTCRASGDLSCNWAVSVPSADYALHKGFISQPLLWMLSFLYYLNLSTFALTPALIPSSGIVERATSFRKRGSNRYLLSRALCVWALEVWRFLGGQGLSFVLRPCVMCMAVWCWWWGFTGGPFSRV